jgi:hypothetical protein
MLADNVDPPRRTEDAGAPAKSVAEFLQDDFAAMRSHHAPCVGQANAGGNWMLDLIRAHPLEKVAHS